MRSIVVALALLLHHGVAQACELVVTDDVAAFNSAVCFEKDGQISAALTSFDFVLRTFPNSKLAPQATARSAVLNVQIVQYDKAAKLFETYAEKYAGEKDAVDALGDAIRLRTGLGDREQRIRDTKFFIRLFGAKRTREAADLMFALTSAFEGDRVATTKHLREYIRQFGVRGGEDHLALAHAKLGELSWERSCPVALVDGLCARRVPAAASACSRVTALVAVARDARAANEAAAEFAQTITIVEGAQLTNDPVVREAYAHAKLLQADRLLEESIAHPLPRLNLVTRGATERSTQRFQKWLSEQSKGGDAIRRAYEAVLQTKSPFASIAATARLGQQTQLLLNQLLAAPQPHDIKRELAKERAVAYCDAMSQFTEPLQARVTEAFSLCAEKAAMLGVADAWSTFCIRQLEIADPVAFPRFNEKIAKPRAWGVPLQVAE